ncbi:MCE family protein [Nocardia exalbida]|uniref:MCE family protein n=1 Tax=Nocardia exalbida TaxID=290231 RepID=UPI0003142165|nr:MCE family protein [Nocardia exalbida]
MKTSTRLQAGGVLLVSALLTAGCRFDGANSIPLPGNTIHAGSYSVRVQLRDTQNLIANSFVKSSNVTIGTITSIVVRDYIAQVTLEIDKDVQLPANSTARLAQTSVLGAQYLELVPPAEGNTERPLREGDLIPLSATSEYPATEDVLAALSLVLNGSGLEQIRTIMAEMNEAFGGHEDAVNRSFARLVTFVNGLDSQRGNIVRAIDSLDSLSKEIAAQRDTLGTGIEQIQPALAVLDEQKTQLTAMFDSVGRFGAQAAQVLRSSQDNLSADLQNLQPTLTQLAAAGSDLAGSLLLALSVPFPVTVADRVVRGDYLNLFLTLDLTVEGVQNKVIGSIPLNRIVPMSNRAVNPLTAPTDPVPADIPAPATTDPNGGPR